MRLVAAYPLRKKDESADTKTPSEKSLFSVTKTARSKDVESFNHSEIMFGTPFRNVCQQGGLDKKWNVLALA